MYNVPDDWGSYYATCFHCGERTHASEGHACGCDEVSEDDVVISEKFVISSATGSVYLHTFIKDTSTGGVRKIKDYAGTVKQFERHLTNGQIKYAERVKLNKPH
tara:strand:- start:1660 stop:1971 length:312 start_codon:yes stop_codon:yes gene_type:complete